MKGSMRKSPDYTSSIAKPTFKAEIDFMAEASTPDVDRQFVTMLIPEQGGQPAVAPKVGKSNSNSKGKVKGY